MAIPDYADTLLPHSHLVDTWSEMEPYQDNISTDMAGGNKRARRFPGDDLSRISFDISFTLSQFAAFQTFVKSTLGLGTSRFKMKVFTGGVVSSRTVQFASKYKPQPQPPFRMIVSFDLWVYPTTEEESPPPEEPPPAGSPGTFDFSSADNSGLVVLLEDI